MTTVPPGAEPDLLSNGSDRDPWAPRSWRPTRRHTRAAVLVLVLVAAAAGVGKLVPTLAQDRARDAASRRDVHFSLAARVGDQAGTTVVTLTSLGRRPVVLQALRVDGYRDPLRVPSLSLTERATTELLLDPVAGCDAAVMPSRMDLVVTTARHVRVRRSLALPTQVRTALRTAHAQLCADSPDEALSWYVTATQVEGSSVVVTYQFENTAVVPITITRFTPLPGLAVSDVALPLRLTPRQPGATTVTRVSLRVSVASCAVLHDQLASPFTDELLALVTTGERTGVAVLTLTDYQSIDGPAEQTNTLKELLGSCR